MTAANVTLHSQFDLKPDYTEAGFRDAYDAFAGRLQAMGFVVSWRTMRRVSHPGYDTNPPPTVFVADLVFVDRDAMLAAWDYVEANEPAVAAVHWPMNKQVCNTTFFLSETVV